MRSAIVAAFVAGALSAALPAPSLAFFSASSLGAPRSSQRSFLCSSSVASPPSSSSSSPPPPPPSLPPLPPLRAAPDRETVQGDAASSSSGVSAVANVGRRRLLVDGAVSSLGAAAAAIGTLGGGQILGGGSVVGAAHAAAAAYKGPIIDVNNAMAREFTAFPGLYPTIATKIVNGAKDRPYASKRDVYAVLTSDLEIERLRQYDDAIVISKPDARLKQFKASQICKYECGSRTSNAYRDEQIKAVQAGRMGRD